MRWYYLVLNGLFMAYLKMVFIYVSRAQPVSGCLCVHVSNDSAPKCRFEMCWIAELGLSLFILCCLLILVDSIVFEMGLFKFYAFK